MLRNRLARAAILVFAAAATSLPPRADDASGAPPATAAESRRQEIRLRARDLSVPDFALTLPDPGWPAGSIGEGRFGVGMTVQVAVDDSGRVVEATGGPVHWYVRDPAGEWIQRPGPYSGEDLLELQRAAVVGARRSRFAVPEAETGGRSGPWPGRVEFRWEFTESRRLAGGPALIVSGPHHDIGLIPAPERNEADVLMPAIIHKQSPEYPADARAAGAEGEVILQAIIDETGAVASPGLLAARGGAAEYTSMVDSALNAVRQWRFEPAMKDGKPVRVYYTLVIEFRLD